jgi:ribosomal protein S18 acetylase RimI-like enzyme
LIILFAAELVLECQKTLDERMTTPLLRQLAHKAMAQTPSPWHRHQPQARHLFQGGLAFNAVDPPGPSFNYVAVLGITRPLDEVVSQADAFFDGKPGGYGVLVEGDIGHPLEEELRRRGWKVFEDEPALVIPDLSPQTLESAQHIPSDLTICLVENETTLRDYDETLCTVFGVAGEMRDTFAIKLSHALEPDMGLFVGYVNQQPVSTSLLLCTANIAVLSGITTLNAYRNRGYGAALTRAALIEGARRGCTAAALRSGPLSVPLYKRVGFQHACWHRTFVRE